ncbi:MAG TPA: transglutaminase [Micromonosporaceae bacterium]|nr:transglutaminase [Micromonosporaceae bacterium]
MSTGWRLRITHRTWFDYAGLVDSSYNEARMSPRSEPRQSVLDSRVDAQPSARIYRYEDYWGTIVTAFDLHLPHGSLAITASALVETSLTEGVEPDDGPGWEDVGSLDRWHELLLPTPRTALDEELTAIAADLRAAHPSPQAAALAACEMVRQSVEYLPGTTGVQTDAVHAWRQRSGVCQDISHLVVGLLRAMGTPARYVSGYLHPQPEGKIGEEVAGQSHAWVEWWAGAWVGFDPTNGVPIQQRHVSVGRGREYGDVPPLKGVYSGPENTGQGVEVLLTRLR